MGHLNKYRNPKAPITGTSEIRVQKIPRPSQEEIAAALEKAKNVGNKHKRTLTN